MIDEKLIENFREEILSSSRPLFLFDDDPDGLGAFLVLYKFAGKGNGWPVKGNIDEALAERVNKYAPDLVVVLDKNEIEEDFFENVSTKIIWLDHHGPAKDVSCLYLNPLVDNPEDNSATSYWAYKIAKQNLWIAAVGIISDWQMLPKDISEEFYAKYSHLLSPDVKDPKDALFNSEIGKLAKIFSFNLKASRKDILSSIKILSRVEDPVEILEGSNPQTRLILKRYEKHARSYDSLMSRVEVNEDKLILFTYNSNENSYTTDLSNDLLNKYPDKMIIIGRESGDSYKCSLRSAKFPVREILETVLSQINGSGGGHPYACGAVIPTEQFQTFIKMFREELENF